ncbi:hypothetical protein BDR03DRAFT_975654 [Suillus americanus]|nr:hypothetical protein BDR03DRAFT_975654 [Suillus americanus]
MRHDYDIKVVAQQYELAENSVITESRDPALHGAGQLLVHVVLCSSSRSPCHTGRSGFRSFSIHIYIYIIHACSDYEAPLDSSRIFRCHVLPSRRVEPICQTNRTSKVLPAMIFQGYKSKLSLPRQFRVPFAKLLSLRIHHAFLLPPRLYCSGSMHLRELRYEQRMLQ